MHKYHGEHVARRKMYVLSQAAIVGIQGVMQMGFFQMKLVLGEGSITFPIQLNHVAKKGKEQGRQLGENGVVNE